MNTQSERRIGRAENHIQAAKRELRFAVSDLESVTEADHNSKMAKARRLIRDCMELLATAEIELSNYKNAKGI